MEESQEPNKVAMDGYGISPQSSGETKKIKKNKRNYWRRKNSKTIIESQENEEDAEISEMIQEISLDIDEAAITEEEIQIDPGISDLMVAGNIGDETHIDKSVNHQTEITLENVDSEVSFTYLDQIQDEDFQDSQNFNETVDTSKSNINEENLLSETDMAGPVVDGQMFNPPKALVSSANSIEEQKAVDEIEEEEQHSTEDQMHSLYNTRFLLKESRTYEVETFTKNAMIIFNHFDITGYDKRYGTEKDVEALKETFGKLGFKDDIFIHNDLDYRGIDKSLEEFSKCDFTQYGCVMVVVLSHGSDGGFIRAKDRSYHESELIDHFFDKHNQSLVTKPKVFVVQACRGTKASKAVVAGRAALVQRDAGKEPQVYTLPTEADVLLLHSSYAGTAAHREIKNGSWFIQTFCQHVNQLADTMDLEAIMTEVKNYVAINKLHEVYNRATSKTDMNKQIPVVMSTLIRKLYLKKPDVVPEDESQPSQIFSMVDHVAVEPRISMLDYGRFVFPKQHFIHMRNALRIFHERQPATTSQILLNIANSIDENVVPDLTMDTTAREISEYLKNNALNWSLYSMIMFLDRL